MPDPAQPVANECPYCKAPMAVTQMTCGHCQVTISAAFPMSRLAGLPVEHQRFIEMFVLAGGNLKEIAEQVGVSYPTIRSRLDKVIEQLRAEIAKTKPVRGNLLDAVDPSRKDGAEEAARLIKDIRHEYLPAQSPRLCDAASHNRRAEKATRALLHQPAADRLRPGDFAGRGRSASRRGRHEPWRVDPGFCTATQSWRRTMKY